MKLKEKYISVIVVLLAIGGGVLIFYFRDWKGFGPAVSPPPLTEESTPTLEDYKTYLLGKSQLPFPKEISANKIEESLLPQELKVFIIDSLNISNINFEKLVYENKAQGFRISYEVNNQDFLGLYTTFGNLAVQNKWEVIRGERTNLYALLELTNDKYNIRISQAQGGGSRINVAIESALKQP